MKRMFLLVLFFLVFLPFVSGEVLISQPDNIYNVDEELVFEVLLNPSSPTNDFLVVDIVCSNETINIYKTPFNLGAGKEKIIELNVRLGTSLIGDLRGQCGLLAKYGGDYINSQSFEITNLINIESDLERNRYIPGDKINVNGLALRRSGGFVEGFVEVNVNSVDVSLSNPVREGKFSFNFTLPKSAFSGQHNMNIRVYEKDNSGKISNERKITRIIEIVPVLSGVEILIDNQNIIPSEDSEISYTVSVYDQAGELIEDKVSLVIYEPGNFVFLERVVDSGQEATMEVNYNYAPGYWKIEAIAGGFSARKLFYIGAVEKIQTSLINDTLVVVNIGNVEYDGPIEISIGSAEQVKRLKLGVGETKRFQLTAPGGDYLIRVKNGDEEVSLGSVALTGNAIRINDLEGGIFGAVSQPILWFLGVLLLILIIVFVHIQKKKRHKNKKEPEKGTRFGSLIKKDSEHIMYGIKETADIIALKTEVKNKNSYVSSAIDKSLMVAKNSGAKVYIDGDYRIIIFSPSLTRKKNNGDIAVKVAKRIEEILDEHNKRNRDKILFGIGLNRGEIISERSGYEFKFTTVGNAIGKAKMIASEANGLTLLSDSMRRAVSGEIKTEKSKTKDAWEVSRISDRGKHEGFLSRFGHQHKK